MLENSPTPPTLKSTTNTTSPHTHNTTRPRPFASLPTSCGPLQRQPPKLLALRSHRRLRSKCRFAASDVKEDYSSTSIDVVADVKTEKIVVLGGSGFVGSSICRAAVSKGGEVVSLSSGKMSSRRVLQIKRREYADEMCDGFLDLLISRACAWEMLDARLDDLLIGEEFLN